jgi:hypothetical protein
MKKIVFIGFTILLSGGCKDYLEVEHLLNNTMDIETVFESKNYSDQWLAGVYDHLEGDNADVASKGNTPFNLISDDMYYNDRRKANDGGRTYNKFKNGEYNEGDEQGTWGKCYRAIRDASTYILHIDKCTAELKPTEISDRKAQARFLRAYYYWLLLRKYGPIPILPVEGLDFTKDYEELSIPRNTYEECAEFIAGELALAAQDLFPNRGDIDVARPTRGAALAARAKVYLYSASPLFNGNTDAWAAQLVDHEGKRLVSETRDETKWAKAAAAAKDVIDLGAYELHTVHQRVNIDGTKKGSFLFREEKDVEGALGAYDYYCYPPVIDPPEGKDPTLSGEGQPWPDGWDDINPFESYRQIFNGEMKILGSRELIFTRGVNQVGEGVKALVIHQMPRSLNGWNAHGLTLKMYDAYYMNDGSEFDRNAKTSEGYTPAIYTSEPKDSNYYGNFLPLPPNTSKQHLNREPRFYASVAYSGSIWEYDGITDRKTNENLLYRQIFYYHDHMDGKQAGDAMYYLPTGIGIKKYYNPKDYATGLGSDGGIVFKPEPAIRYAEVLLIYAEALNELSGKYSIPAYDGKKVFSVERDPFEMKSAMRQIRFRAGLPDFEDGVYTDPDKFRKKLKRERQIELMGEGHRYFDLRRWKDALVEENTLVRGFNMNMNSTERELFDTPVDVLTLPSIFVDKMYLWPISHGELKRNRKLTQNPGWSYFTE